jgi:hypothetical protein
MKNVATLEEFQKLLADNKYVSFAQKSEKQQLLHLQLGVKYGFNFAGRCWLHGNLVWPLQANRPKVPGARGRSLERSIRESWCRRKWSRFPYCLSLLPMRVSVFVTSFCRPLPSNTVLQPCPRLCCSRVVRKLPRWRVPTLTHSPRCVPKESFEYKQAHEQSILMTPRPNASAKFARKILMNANKGL